MLKVL